MDRLPFTQKIKVLFFLLMNQLTKVMSMLKQHGLTIFSLPLSPYSITMWTVYCWKSGLKNMAMSSEAWKERPRRPSMCFHSTFIYFYSFLNQKQAAKYIFGGPLAPNMLPERHRWRFKNHPWGVPLGGPHLQHPFTTVNNICPGLKANKNLTNAHVL